MYCHLCQNGAIGLCRHCYKFYCREHGDGFCSACQQKGWTIDESGTGSISMGSLTLRPLSQATPSETPSETSTPTTPVTSSISRAVRGGSSFSSSTGFIDRNALEDLTDPAHFVGLLPAFGSSKVNDVLMLLKGIECYEAAFRFELIMRFGFDTADDLLSRGHMSSADLVLSDDVGTNYSLFQRGGGGNNRDWSQHYIVTPALNPPATTLTLQVLRLQVHQHMTSRSRMRPVESSLVGPWTLTVRLPPHAERF